MDPKYSRVLKLFNIELPIIQAPMAGATTPDMVIAVAEAGGLGSLPGAQTESISEFGSQVSVVPVSQRPRQQQPEDEKNGE
jgi:NAD(P)H-dependent flavin oxidoreductase YrpB (nitropropane dioxygenase family)